MACLSFCFELECLEGLGCAVVAPSCSKPYSVCSGGEAGPAPPPTASDTVVGRFNSTLRMICSIVGVSSQAPARAQVKGKGPKADRVLSLAEQAAALELAKCLGTSPPSPPRPSLPFTSQEESLWHMLCSCMLCLQQTKEAADTCTGSAATPMCLAASSLCGWLAQVSMGQRLRARGADGLVRLQTGPSGLSEEALWYGIKMQAQSGGRVRQAIKAANTYEKRLLPDVVHPQVLQFQLPGTRVQLCGPRHRAVAKAACLEFGLSLAVMGLPGSWK